MSVFVFLPFPFVALLIVYLAVRANKRTLEKNAKQHNFEKTHKDD